ncbi:MAG: pilus assembly protein PilP [Polaromonas sp.]|nr:pilus assembly protein PilP [Polaromonas sp.]
MIPATFSNISTFRIAACLSLIALTGCFNSKNDELKQWMVAERGNTVAQVKPVSEPKKFIPQAYDQASEISPFNNQKLLQALRRDNTQSSTSLALLSPELSRRKEALESAPLDTISMVGSIDKNKSKVGLLKVDKLLYQVKVGNYIGQNYGRITKISDTEIVLREIVQDAAGEWIERIANLQLQGNEK